MAATLVRIISREQVDGVDYAWVVIPDWDGETARRVRTSELPPELWDRVVWGRGQGRRIGRCRSHYQRRRPAAMYARAAISKVGRFSGIDRQKKGCR